MSKIFKSEIYQDENGIIDASKLYKDAEEGIAYLRNLGIIL